MKEHKEKVTVIAVILICSQEGGRTTKNLSTEYGEETIFLLVFFSSQGCTLIICINVQRGNFNYKEYRRPGSRSY